MNYLTAEQVSNGEYFGAKNGLHSLEEPDMWERVFLNSSEHVDFFFSNSPVEAMQYRDVHRLIADKIQSNHVMIFSKSYCPYCRAAKALLTAKQVYYDSIELDQVADGA